MARKNSKPSEGEVGPERTVIIHLKGSTEYAAWLDELAETTHIPKASLFRLAMAEYAKSHGHKPPPAK